MNVNIAAIVYDHRVTLVFPLRCFSPLFYYYRDIHFSQDFHLNRLQCYHIDWCGQETVFNTIKHIALDCFVALPFDVGVSVNTLHGNTFNGDVVFYFVVD